MGDRGPKPSGSVKTSVRLSAGVRAQLEAAAVKRNVTVSQEIENRLSRSFIEGSVITDEFGDRQLYAVARLAFAAAKSTVGRRNQPTPGVVPGPRSSWLYDPQAFDAGVAAINKVLDLVRPTSPPPDADTASDTARPYQPEFNALETVLEIQKAPATQPIKASRHMRATITLRADIGDIVDRAVIRGVDADQVRKRNDLAKEFGALRRKQARKPDTMTNEEINRLKALAAQIERLLR